MSALLPPAHASAANFSTGSDPAVKYGVHEIVFTGNGSVADPFATAATVTFSPPSGVANAKTVEMFWDGGNTWRARAYVTETGNWTWNSACASDGGLAGKSGSFSAGSSTLRGKLKPHPAKARALVTDNGQWFAPIGDTAYYMLGSSAYQNYVRDDWNHGINFLRCAAFGDLRSYSARFTEQSMNGIPKLSSLQSDDTKLKWMLENYPGIYLQYIMFRETASGDWSKYSTTAKNQLMQQMVARYAAFPGITWMIMNDSAYPTTDTGDTAVANIVSAFLVARDPYQKLRCTGARRGKGAAFAGSSWTTFLHFETQDAMAADEADSNASYNKFTWCGEDRYETYIPPTHDRYFFRRLMWAWLLSGGSACYGGDWDATIPYDSTSFVGLDSVQYIKGYFESRNIDLGLFAYNDSLATDALATGKDRPQVCNMGTSEYIIYHPNGTGTGADVNVNGSRTASFSLNLAAASGTFNVEWFRCLDGVTAAGSTVAGGAARTLTAPWAGQDVVCRLTGGTSVPDTEAPSVPQGAAATPQSSSSILVTWLAATDNVGVAGYDVYRDASMVGSSTTNSFTDGGLTASTAYSYTVKSKDTAGNVSAASTPAAATTLAPDVTAPTVPENLSANAASSTAILLTWSASTDDAGVAGYEVYRNGTYADTVTGTSFSDTGLAASTTYGYTLKAFDAAGNTSAASSPPASATTQAEVPPGTPVIYQAESATFVGLTAVTSGAITYLDANPASATVRYVEWDITAGVAGMHDLMIRYSMGTTPERPMKIEVNGVVVVASYSLPRSPSNMAWGTYADSAPLQVTLNAGANKVRATAATGNPRLDYLKVTPMATLTPVQAWRQAHFGTSANTGIAADDADPNHNGIVNQLEYALGGDPLGNTTGVGILPQAGRSAGDHLQIRFTRYPERSDLTLTAQAADSLAGAWSDLAVSMAGAPFLPIGAATAAETGTGSTRSVTVTDLYPMSDPNHTRRFMRLKTER